MPDTKGFKALERIPETPVDLMELEQCIRANRYAVVLEGQPLLSQCIKAKVKRMNPFR